MSYARLLGEWLTLLLGAALFVIFAIQGNWVQRLDATLLDYQSSLRLSEPSDRITLVEIDDRSLGALGNWPWDRSHHADLLDELGRYGPDVVLYDVLFIEPTAPDSDADLTRAIGASGNVVLAHHFGPMPNTVDEMRPSLPYEPFLGAAAGTGHVAVAADEDGVVRRFAMAFEAAGQSWPHISLVALREALDDPDFTGSSGSTPIVPMHSSGAFRKVSAADVIAGTTPSDYLAGQIVLVGATAQGLGDRYSVAEHAGRLMPGVEIQANLISSLLQGETIQPVSKTIAQIVLILVIAALFTAWWKLSPAASLRATGIVILGLLAASLVLLVFAGLWLPVSGAILAIMIAYPIWGWRRLSAVSRFLDKEAQRLTPTFAVEDKTASGFDVLARQVSQVSFLVGETKDRLSFVSRIIEASPDAMMVFGEEDELILMNQEAEKLFGAKSEARGQTFAALLGSAKATLDREKGEVVFGDSRVFLLARSQDDSARENQILALRDVTELRNNEKDRAAMLEFLSHDMRSPQVAIIGLSTGKGVSIDEPERFSRIESQARRTLKLTDDFVQIARLEHNGISPEETDIGALLYEALDRAYPEARKKKIALKSAIPEEPEFCVVDPLAISRGIDNLVGNALKFSQPGTAVTLSLAREDSDAVLISVADQGPGLPAERLREPFARFGANDAQAGPSAGLGLAYVKRVVDEHQGEISVHSSADEGTRFTLRIPCSGHCS